MHRDVAMAIVEALGESLLVKNRNLENCQEHIRYLAEMNEKLRQENGELKGRDDEKIKAECEAIEKGEAIPSDVPCTPLTACNDEAADIPCTPCADTCEAATCAE